MVCSWFKKDIDLVRFNKSSLPMFPLFGGELFNSGRDGVCIINSSMSMSVKDFIDL